MDLPNKRILKFNSLDYLNNRRLVLIQKSKRPLQLRLQRINNEVIDDFVLSYSIESRESNIRPEVYIKQVQDLNQMNTSQHFARVLDNSLVKTNGINKTLARLHSAKVSSAISKVEIERIEKNLEWTREVLANADLQIETYTKLADKLSPTSSRKLMIEKSLETGTSVTGREYSYKELKNVSKDLEKYKTNSLDLEARRLENRQAILDGLQPLYTTKSWVWSAKEKTRHESMDGQTVPLDSKFEVLNETTGEVDYLLFPGDFENENHNCSNTCNCACSYIINRA